MRICELKEKEVINYKNCERLGYVGDVSFNLCTGCLEELIIPGPCKLWGILGRDHEYIIPWKCVCQIGPDVILVDINMEECLKKCV